MEGTRVAMRDAEKRGMKNSQGKASRVCCRIGNVRSFHPSLLRQTSDIADTTSMVLSIRQLVSVALLLLFYFPLFCSAQGSKKGDLLRYLSNQSGFVHYARFRGQPAPSNELRAILDRQARWDDAQQSDPSGSGLRLHFEKIDEQAMPGGHVAVRYRIFAEGAPQDKVFVLQTWLVNDAISTDPRDIYVNAQGLLMIHKPKPEEEASLKAGDDELDVLSATDGAEPMRFLLARRDGETAIYGTLVAHPVVSYDQGCRLEVRIAQPGATSVLIDADGFPAKTKIPLVLESEGALANEVLETNADGHAVIAVLTAVPGKTQGTLKASAEGPNCLPSVLQPWNTAGNAPKH